MTMKKLIPALLCIITVMACQTKNNSKAVENNTTDKAKMAQPFPSPKVEIKTIGIYLYDGYAALDAMGPYTVFSELMGARVFFVAKHKGFIDDGRGMKVQVDTSIDEVKHLDVLLIPGGLKETYLQTKDTALLSWIRSIDSTSKYTTSVCTGAWILGAAGLLKDKEATTHWYGKKRLADDFGAKIQNTRYAHSGKYWTSAGVTAGMDMSLALMNEIAGEKYTKTAMLGLEYDPQPPFRGGSESNTDKELVEAVRAMYDNGMEAALHPEKMFTDMKFDNAKDFVCGMPLTAGVMDTAHYNGKVFGFCSGGCKDMFLKSPATYWDGK
jgi:putative intracellular protease/amidase/YHS domain-containing protein